MSLFPQRVRELRIAHGLIQRELAEIAGVKLRAYQLYEQGKTEPGIDVLIKFADVLGVSLDELVGRDSTLSRGASVEESQTSLPEHPNV